MSDPYSISIIIPARNEQGNIEKLIKRIPVFPAAAEIIIVEGHSEDDTYAEIEKTAEKYSKRLDIRCVRQAGEGKADAVWKGFALAQNDILIILDADISVWPEELPRFYEKIIARGGLINGTRLVYKMEKGAMRTINYWGNKLFAFLLGKICGRRLTDTLCGSKALFKSDFLKIKNSPVFGALTDPFGDFTLLLGAHYVGLPINELPVFYRRRTFGKTQIKRFRDGFKLILIILKYRLIFGGKKNS